jgi:hypothetical protein
MITKKKLCGCCDTTDNKNGVCDTCKVLNDMDKRDKLKSFLRFITSWGFILGFVIGYIIITLIVRYILKW